MSVWKPSPQPLIPVVLDETIRRIINTPRAGRPRITWRVHSALDAYRLGLLLAADTRMAAATAGWAWDVVLDDSVPADKFMAECPVVAEEASA